MTTRPNLLVFAITLAGTIVSGIWLAQFFFGVAPSWGVGGALFAFLILGSIAFRMNRDYTQLDEAHANDRALERAKILQLYAEPPPPAGGEHFVMAVNGRNVERYKPKDPHEAAWRDALEGFLYHAWTAQSLSGPSLIGRAVASADEWFAITEVLTRAGILSKKNGVGTTFAQSWTYRRAIAAVQLGEVAIVFPTKPPPTILKRADSLTKGASKAESLGSPGKPVEA